MRRTLTPLVAAIAVGALSLVAAPPAAAASTGQSFSLRTAGAGTYYGDGYAVTSGRLTFFTGGNRVLITGSLDDVCQSGTTGDGYAARLILAVVYTDGYKASNVVGTDDRGCSQGAISVRLDKTYPKRVRQVQLILGETNLQNGVIGDSKLSTFRDNPYT